LRGRRSTAPNAMATANVEPSPTRAHVEGLRAFLRGRALNARSGFDAIDVHDVGQLTSDAFAKGLRKLGFQGDAVAAFRALDVAQAGLLSRRAFVEAVESRDTAVDEDSAASPEGTLGASSRRSVDSSPTSQSAWSSAYIPRLGSDGQLPRPPRRKSSRSSLDQPLPPPAPDAAGTAAVDELSSRLTQIEQRIIAMGSARELDCSASLGMSEQLDALRMQLLDEREQRSAETSALRAEMAVSKTEARQIASEAQARAREEWTSSIEALRTELLERQSGLCEELRCEVVSAATTAAGMVGDAEGNATAAAVAAVSKLDAKLSDIHAALERRVAACEMSTTLDTTMEVPQADKPHSKCSEDLRDLRLSLELLQDRVDSALADAQRDLAKLRETVERTDAPAHCSQFKAEVKTSIGGLEQRLMELQEQVDSKRQIGDMATPCTVQQLQVSSDRLDSRIDELAKSVESSMAKTQSCMHDRVEGLINDRSELLRVGLATIPDPSAGDVSAVDRVAAVEVKLDNFVREHADNIGKLVARLSKIENDDRIGTLDNGVARMSAELRTQSAAMESLQVEQKSFSVELRNRLTSLLCRVEESSDYVAAMGSQNSLPASDVTVGSWSQHHQQRQQGPRLLGSIVSRSRSCGDMKHSRDFADEAHETLHALREENLRLREENLGIRECAAQATSAGSGEEDTSSGQVVANPSPAIASRAVPAQVAHVITAGRVTTAAVPVHVRQAIVVPQAPAAKVVRLSSYGSANVACHANFGLLATHANPTNARKNGV